MSDLFTLDSDISAAVSRALDVMPAVSNPASAAKARAVDPAAFDLYLRGVSHTLRGNEPDLDQAIALLEQSAAIDPAFQSTQAYLALAYGNKSATYRPNEPIWEEKGFAAAQKALLLDPDSPEAHYAQAVMLWRPSHAFPSKEALAELRKALAVRQNFDEAWHQYGVILTHVGHLDDAVRAIERAVQINPRNTFARFRFAPIRVYQLQFEEAIAALNRVPPDTFPAQWTYQRAWALLSLGRLDEARTVIDRALVENPVDQGGVLHSARGMLRAMAGDRSGAEADIADAIRVGKSFIHFHHTAYAIGAIYTRLGNMDRAQEWIENAANDGFPNFTYFENDPHLERLRAVPRFRTFLAKLRQEWEHLPGESD